MFDGADMKSVRDDALAALFDDLDQTLERKIGAIHFRELVDMERARREGRPYEGRGRGRANG